MGRKDLCLLFLFCAALLAAVSPVWSRFGAVFFNHGDLFAYHAPLRHLSAEGLQQGRLPFWDPYIMLGVPHLANPQTALFYPVSLLGFFLPTTIALTWDQIFHLLFSGAGIFLLARAQRLNRSGAFVLACAYALSPFLIYRITAGIPTLLAALAWIPWLWLFWLSGPPGFLSAAWALQLFSGHPQFLIINAVGMLVWALIRASRGALIRRWMHEAIPALALGAIQWILTAQFLRLSVRAGWAGAASPLYAFSPGNLAAFLWPGLWGTPVAGTWRGVVSVFYETCAGNLGPVALAFAVLGAARGKRRLPALALSVLGVFLALGPHGPLCLLSDFPVFGYLRAPARWIFLSLWGVLLLAGSGLAVWRSSVKAATAAVLFGFLLPVLWAMSFLRPQDPRPFLASHPDIPERLSGRVMRVLTDPELANPNKTIFYHLRNVNGYEAFYLAGVPAWAAAAQGAPAADASRVFISRWRSPLLEQAGAAARLSGRGIEEASAWPLAVFLDSSGRRVTPDPRITLPSPESWRLGGAVPSQASVLAISQPAYPGWRARLRDVPADLLRAGLFLLLRLPQPVPGGASLRLSLDFSPTGWFWLVLTAMMAWGGWLSMVLRRVETP